MIAVPNLGHLHVNLVEVLLRWHFQQGSYETITLLMPRGIQPHDAARNYCVNAFLQTDFTHLFFIDSDVVPPIETLDQLLDADKDVIAGLYPTMKFKNNMQVKEHAVYNRVGRVVDGETKYGLEEAHGSGIQEIDRAGTGCLLIKRKVLETMERPHFQFLYSDLGISAVGEDINFCKKAQEAGFKIHAHFGVVCQHAKEILL